MIVVIWSMMESDQKHFLAGLKKVPPPSPPTPLHQKKEHIGTQVIENKEKLSFHEQKNASKQAVFDHFEDILYLCLWHFEAILTRFRLKSDRFREGV